MFTQVLTTEFLKLRHSKVPLLTFLAFSIGPLAGGLFMWIAAEPERAGRLGLLGTKASLIGLSASWPAYFILLTQMIGTAGPLLLAVLAAYVFGREYADGTAKNLLALPVGRHGFGLAKLIVVAVWWALLVAAILIEALVVGIILRIPGLSMGAFAAGVRDVVLAASIGYLLTPVIAWIASLGRGYLPPLGFAMLMLVLGNIFGVTGWGKWFPWSIVPLFAGVAGPRVETLAPGSLVVVAVTFLAGVAATIAQLRWADNAQ
jgi:ABC-type transport system involved in multi-copper enzyme maturation permease subunit